MPKKNKQTIVQSAKQQISSGKAYRQAQAIELWRETRGHISNICRTIGINRSTFYKWIKNDPEFRQAIADAEAEFNDDVRDALVQNIADGKSQDIQFYLKKRHPDFKDKPTVLQQFNTEDMKIEFIKDEGGKNED